MKLKDMDDNAFETWIEEREWPVSRPLKKKKGFYDTSAWFKLRRQVLERWGRQCMKCGSLEQINVDHIKPRFYYPELSLEFNNLQVLCYPCNKEKNISTADYRPTHNLVDI